ncbi:hypothetical protein PNOK_0205300 [Pyrrhoderma noxium]|uniref:Uncharacterized protein n=1 Tax=Pyrrhoderma noxium TaxID=2282107 RepID=A0A286UR65_9AGAM|nr:hypothetical protein PNOK_0205300 [Pyrrhoderma noxium]
MINRCLASADWTINYSPPSRLCFFQTAATINWLGAGVSLDTLIKSVELKKTDGFRSTAVVLNLGTRFKFIPKGQTMHRRS